MLPQCVCDTELYYGDNELNSLTIVTTRFYLSTLGTNVKPKSGCHVTSLCQGLRRSGFCRRVAEVKTLSIRLVKTLIYAGVNINAKQRCGATALSIAVLKKNEEICKFLQENFAIFNDNFFPTIPSPHIIARKLELGVADLMDEKSKAEIATIIELRQTVRNSEEIEQPIVFPKRIKQMQITNNTNMKVFPYHICW